MKLAKIVTSTIISFVILAICFICIYNFVLEKSKTIFIGENDSWHCEFKVDLYKNKYSDLYETKLTLKYKDDIIPASNIKAQLTHANSDITSIEMSNPSATSGMKNPIQIEDGMSGMFINSLPLNLYINLDGKEENITLYKK